MWATNRLRSSDFRLAQACLEALHGTAVPTGTRALRDLIMLIDEVADDLGSVARDRAESSFNTVLAYERIHGPVRGPTRLAEHLTGLRFALLDRIGVADRAQAIDVLVYVRPGLDRAWIARGCRSLPLPLLRVAAKYVATRTDRAAPAGARPLGRGPGREPRRGLRRGR